MVIDESRVPHRILGLEISEDKKSWTMTIRPEGVMAHLLKEALVQNPTTFSIRTTPFAEEDRASIKFSVIERIPPDFDRYTLLSLVQTKDTPK